MRNILIVAAIISRITNCFPTATDHLLIRCHLIFQFFTCCFRIIFTVDFAEGCYRRGGQQVQTSESGGAAASGASGSVHDHG